VDLQIEGPANHTYAASMSTTAVEILEQFRKLPLPERRELVQVLLRETSGSGTAPARPRRSVAELRTFEATPCDDLKDHDRWFAEAILASKRGSETP
jgi:hypothetical protein